MTPQAVTQIIELGDGRTIKLETGKLAKQAHGSCMLTMGNTMLLATVVATEEARDGIDFLPLTIEYREKFSAAGKFPGGFFKREARPSENEILTARLIDRALRPLFPDDFHGDTQVMITMYSSDDTIYPDSLACLAASAAIAVSDIPFNGPVSEVRMGRVDGQIIVNPTREQLEESDLDMVIAATEENIMMLEGEMQEISEEDMVEVIRTAHEAIKVQCQAQRDLAAAFGRPETREYSHEEDDKEFFDAFYAATYQKVYDMASEGIANKKERGRRLKEIKDSFLSTYPEEDLADKSSMIPRYWKKIEKAGVRNAVLDNNKRLDGRKMDEIRPIWSEVDVLPATHGSAVFTRGETQSLTSITLGTKMDEQSVDTPLGKFSQKFMLHYNFPGFSTGEARPIRGTSRREIGHGNLAQRALAGMIPDDMPYTVRVLSDILESNGSSSMATVCAGCLALMDGGVQMKRPVSGIAMGLIFDEESGRYAVLSDILGDEDFLGDMDFKVTGTPNGITACQMDIKINGLPYDVLIEALEQSNRGRAHILDEMLKTIDKPREDYKEHAPRIVQMRVPKEFIGQIIGPGGKVIQEMQAVTNTKIVIDEDETHGVVDIVGLDKASIDSAIARIKAITQLPEEGEIYEGTVKSIKDFGAFVEFLPGREGLLHISEVSWTRIESLEGLLNPGDSVKVKLVEINPVTGKFRLSRKVLLEVPEGVDPNAQQERRGGGDRRGGGGRGRRDDRRGGGGRGRRDDRRDDRRGGGRRDDRRDDRPREDRDNGRNERDDRD